MTLQGSTGTDSVPPLPTAPMAVYSPLLTRPLSLHELVFHSGTWTRDGATSLSTVGSFNSLGHFLELPTVHRQERRLAGSRPLFIVMTGYRILNGLVILAFATVKLGMALHGYSAVPTISDWLSGVLFAAM